MTVKHATIKILSRMERGAVIDSDMLVQSVVDMIRDTTGEVRRPHHDTVLRELRDYRDDQGRRHYVCIDNHRSIYRRET